MKDDGGWDWGDGLEVEGRQREPQNQVKEFSGWGDIKDDKQAYGLKTWVDMSAKA